MFDSTLFKLNMSVVFHFILVVILVYVDIIRMKSNVRVDVDRIRMK